MLVTAGCSFVWGDELDGHDLDPPNHWKHTFTHILAHKLGVSYANLGLCGACNDQIFRKVVDFFHNNPSEHVTHMVVLWSAWQRDEWVEYQPARRSLQIKREHDVTQFSSLRTSNLYTKKIKEIVDDWYERCYDNRTDIMHTMTKMKMVEMMCEQKGIKLIQGAFHRRNYSNIMAIMNNIAPNPEAQLHPDMDIDRVPQYKKWLENSLSSLKPTSKVGLGNSGIMKDLYTLALENVDVKEFGHPGEQTNLQYANLLFENFTKMENGEL